MDNSLKDLLDKLYEESETRNKANMEISDYESISYEVGVQSTIEEIRKWAEKNSWLNDVKNCQVLEDL